MSFKPFKNRTLNTRNLAELNRQLEQLYAGAGGGQNLEDLSAGTAPDGTETLPALQAGAPVTLTAAQLAGNKADALMGMSRDKHRVFSRFIGPVPGSTLSAAGAGTLQLVPNESGFFGIVDNGATDSKISFFGGFNQGHGTALLQTDGGWVSLFTLLEHWDWNGKEADFRAAVTFTLGNAPDKAGDEFELYVGAFPMPDGTAPTQGTFFRASDASANWECFVGDGTTDTGYVDTGVPVVSDSNVVNPTVLRVVHNKDLNQTEFYVDGGNPVHTVADATQGWFVGNNGFGGKPIQFGTYMRAINSTGVPSGAAVSALRLDVDYDLNTVGGNDLI